MPSRMKFCPACAAPLAARESEGRLRQACTSRDCDYVFYDNPVPVVAALLEHGETVLLVRNKGWPEKWYGLVSGFLEKGESPEEGVLREVKEEVGLKGEIVSFIGAYPFAEMNQVILAYHVRGHGGITMGDEIAGSRRCPPTSCGPGRWAPGMPCATGWRHAADSGPRSPESFSTVGRPRLDCGIARARNKRAWHNRSGCWWRRWASTATTAA